MKLVLNKCYGGFGLSAKAIIWLHKHGGAVDKDDLERATAAVGKKKASIWDSQFYAYSGSEERSNPLLVKCVETLGSKAASGSLGELSVVEIPDGIAFEIDDYDGIETVHEEHRSW